MSRTTQEIKKIKPDVQMMDDARLTQKKDEGGKEQRATRPSVRVKVIVQSEVLRSPGSGGPQSMTKPRNVGSRAQLAGGVWCGYLLRLVDRWERRGGPRAEMAEKTKSWG
jgi:hypothetical protein